MADLSGRIWSGSSSLANRSAKGDSPFRPAAPLCNFVESMKRGHLMILLVEDEENDIYFVQRATEQSAAGHTVYAVKDGEEAIRYLLGKGEYADRESFPMPNVVLTDLK